MLQIKIGLKFNNSRARMLIKKKICKIAPNEIKEKRFNLYMNTRDNQMQQLPVIFSRSYLPLSYVIRLLDKGAAICPFSHVGIISECGNYVYESKGGKGVIKTPLWVFKDIASYWEEGLFPTVNKQKAYERAESQLGKPYDLIGAIAVGVPFIKRDWGCPDSWFCSEYLAYCSGIFEERHISNIGVNFCYALTRTKRL